MYLCQVYSHTKAAVAYCQLSNDYCFNMCYPQQESLTDDSHVIRAGPVYDSFCIFTIFSRCCCVMLRVLSVSICSPGKKMRVISVCLGKVK